MFRRHESSVREKAVEAGTVVSELAQDNKFRAKLLAALGHATAAQQRARRLTLLASAARIAADTQVRNEMRRLTRDLQAAWGRAQKKRSHRLRNSMLVAVGGGAAAAMTIPQSRKWLMSRAGLDGRATPRVIDAALQVDVPVSKAYNQWTQFEDFPQFMEGVDEVQQLDDTRLPLGGEHRWETRRVGRQDHRAAPRQASHVGAREQEDDARHSELRTRSAQTGRLSASR